MIWPSDQNYLEGLIKFCAGWNIHLANLKFAQLKIHALLHLVISIWYTLEPIKQGYRQYFVFINFPSEHMCLFRGKDDCSVFFQVSVALEVKCFAAFQQIWWITSECFNTRQKLYIFLFRPRYQWQFMIILHLQNLFHFFIYLVLNDYVKIQWIY